jgi:hypothetical protein
MNWLINETIKRHQNKYKLYLNVDKNLSPFTFTYPATWTGKIIGDINNTFKDESGDVILLQTDRTVFEKIKYPEIVDGEVYDEIIEVILQKMHQMD